jgi:MFS transporter, OPA family, glycerol-3-phosphate transporter
MQRPAMTPADGPVHSPEFRTRRAYNWLTLGLTYAAMYMARYNFSFANKSLSDAYGFSKVDIGWILFASNLIYGISAIANGPIADRIGGRKAMLIGSAGACVFNLAFGLGAYAGFLGTGTLLLAYLATIWTLNMYFQSYSALALIKVNSAWFHITERGVFSAVFGSIIQLGRFAVFALMTMAAVVALPWQWKFFLPSIIVSLFFLLTFLFVRDVPSDTGHDDFDTHDATSGDTETVNLAYVARKVFTNPVALTIAAAEFCTGAVRKGFEEWFPRYMQEVQNLPLDSAIFKKNAGAVVAFGIAGAFAAGFMSAKVFKHRRPPVAFMGYVLQVGSLAIVWAAPSVTAVVVAFSINSFAISMVHSMLSGTASMDFGGKRAAATAAGMFDGMQYVGGAAASLGIAALLEAYGWTIWGPSMIGFAVVGGLLMLTLWNARPGRGAAMPAPAEPLPVAKIQQP